MGAETLGEINPRELSILASQKAIAVTAGSIGLSKYCQTGVDSALRKTVPRSPRLHWSTGFLGRVNLKGQEYVLISPSTPEFSPHHIPEFSLHQDSELFHSTRFQNFALLNESSESLQNQFYLGEFLPSTKLILCAQIFPNLLKSISAVVFFSFPQTYFAV